MSGLIATGVAKLLLFAKETTFGVAATATAGQLLRRTTSTVDLTKATYQSAEIRPDYQISDMRHGTRSVTGAISGEVSVGTYELFMAAVLRQNFQIAPSTGSITNVTATVAGPQFTRAAGSFLTDGFFIGDVVKWTGFTQVANDNHYFLITALSATQMTGIFLDGNPVVADATNEAVVCTLVGKKTWTPLTGQTKDSFTIEHFFADIAQDQTFLGCRISEMAVKLPSTGMATVDFTVMGVDSVLGTAQYFTNPVAATSGRVLAAVNGAVYVGGVKVAVITSLDFTVNGNMTSGTVVGSNITPDIFVGSVGVTGNMSVYFLDQTFMNAFYNELEVAISTVFTTDSTPTPGFMAFNFPRCKYTGTTKNDGQVGLVQTVPFTALLNNASPIAGSIVTTMSIQDSAAV